MLKPIKKIIINVSIICIAATICNTASALEKTVFKGMVVDVENKAVRGVEIFLYNTRDTRRPADFISARSDIDGRFRMIIPVGRYWAVARLRKGEKYGPLMIGDKHSGEPIEIELDASEEFEQDFIIVDIKEAARLIKKTREDYFKLVGRLVDKKGIPVENAYVIASRQKKMPDIPDYLSAWTDEHGEYILYLPAGKYYVGYATEFPPGSTSHIVGEVEIQSKSRKLNIIVDAE